MVLNLASLLIGYLLGSIPVAYIVTKLKKGIDIRDVDTGNVGAASVLRTSGFGQGFGVLLGDMAKGAAAILVAQALDVSLYWVMGAGFAAILGHSFPIYIGFRGGQGVATIIGLFLVLAPEAMGITLVLIIVILLFNRRIYADRVFFAVVCAAPALPLCIWLINGSIVLTFYSLAVIIFVVFRNRRRLRHPKTATTMARNGRAVNQGGIDPASIDR
jgi:glycerol-3-phosphate acyltransferase PlsY